MIWKGLNRMVTEKKYLSAVENVERYDVVVAGGGPAGFAAAMSASRIGLSTLLIESGGCIGGTSTRGALPFWLGAKTGSVPYKDMIESGIAYEDLPRPRSAVGGVFLEAVERIKAAQGGVGPCKLAQTDEYPGLSRLGCHDEFTFDIETGKRVLDEMVIEAEVQILYHTMLIGAEANEGRVCGVYTANKDGVVYTQARLFVDCTGDADLVSFAGFETTKAKRETGAVSSLVAHIENIDSGKIEEYLNGAGNPWFRGFCEQAKQANPDSDLPDELIMFPMLQKGVFMINGGTAFAGYDGTSAEDITKLMIRGRQRAKLLVEKLFKPYIPGAGSCRLRMTAVYPGIRETRRIAGEYSLTEEDLLCGKEFGDTIALGGRHFDLTSGGKQPFIEKGLSVCGGITRIPYRSMMPRNSSNIIAAGRCIDAQGQALGPVRVMSTCMALGQAAGTAAAMCKEKDLKYIDVDCGELRQKLKEQGAIVD